MGAKADCQRPTRECLESEELARRLELLQSALQEQCNAILLRQQAWLLTATTRASVKKPFLVVNHNHLSADFSFESPIPRLFVEVFGKYNDSCRFVSEDKLFSNLLL